MKLSTSAASVALFSSLFAVSATAEPVDHAPVRLAQNAGETPPTGQPPIDKDKDKQNKDKEKGKSGEPQKGGGPGNGPEKKRPENKGPEGGGHENKGGGNPPSGPKPEFKKPEEKPPVQKTQPTPLPTKPLQTPPELKKPELKQPELKQPESKGQTPTLPQNKTPESKGSPGAGQPGKEFEHKGSDHNGSQPNGPGTTAPQKTPEIKTPGPTNVPGSSGAPNSGPPQKSEEHKGSDHNGTQPNAPGTTAPQKTPEIKTPGATNGPGNSGAPNSGPPQKSEEHKGSGGKPPFGNDQSGKKPDDAGRKFESVAPNGPPGGAPGSRPPQKFVVPGQTVAPPVARDLNDLKSKRHEVKEDDGKRTVIEEPDRRRIIREEGKTIIRSDETERFRRIAPDTRIEKRDGFDISVSLLPGGIRIFTDLDERGRPLRRYRRGPDGRDVILFDNRDYYRRHREHGSFLDAIIDLPPPVIRIPRERYVLDYERASDEDIYETLDAPPVDRLDRGYSLEEVRQSPMLRDRMRRVDLDAINFEFGSWTVEEDQYGELERIARAMNRIIDRNPDEMFLIEGHTDAVGSDEDNLSLSDRRAEAVAVVLTEQFNVPPENLTTQGYGEQYLKIPTEGPERANRRVAVRRITPLLAR